MWLAFNYSCVVLTFPFSKGIVLDFKQFLKVRFFKDENVSACIYLSLQYIARIRKDQLINLRIVAF